MKKIAIAFVVIALAFLAGVSLRAQAPTAYTMSGQGTHATCVTPASGSYFLCVATDGVWVSNSGGAYFQIVPQSAQTAGVTSVQVGNGTPMTGTVVLPSIPSKAVSTTTTTIQ